MWSNQTPHTWLMGLENGAATVENKEYFKMLRKSYPMTRHFTPRWDEIRQKNELEEKEKCVSTRRTAHKCPGQDGGEKRQQRKGSSTDQQANNTWSACIMGWFLAIKKECSLDTDYSTDEPWKQHAFVRSRKTTQWKNPLTGNFQTRPVYRHRKQMTAVSNNSMKTEGCMTLAEQ